MITGVIPNWSAPQGVGAFTTTREQGFSSHNPEHRLLLKPHFNLSYEPLWLNQTHSNLVVYIDENTKPLLEADASWTDKPGRVCVINIGDCLPVLLCDQAGTVVGAAHAGWRGLAAGIVENTVNAMRTKAQGDIIAWLGPAIGPMSFEVGQDVLDAFVALDPNAAHAFTPLMQNGKWLANIYELAKLKLEKLGVTEIYGGDHCTYTDQARFYSYRRTKTPCRMASLIWLKTSL